MVFNTLQHWVSEPLGLGTLMIPSEAPSISVLPTRLRVLGFRGLERLQDLDRRGPRDCGLLGNLKRPHPTLP